MPAGVTSSAERVDMRHALSLVSLLVVVAGNVRGQNCVGAQDLGTLSPSGSWTGAGDVSADGRVVVGIVGGSPRRAYRWTAAGGMQDLGTLPGGFEASAYATSADGSVVVGTASDPISSKDRAFRWTAANGMQMIGTWPSGGFEMGASAVSADGTVVVGWVSEVNKNRAFRWTEAGGTQDLGILSGVYHHLGATAVSADGSVVVGLAWEPSTFISRAFRWTEAGGMQDLGTLPGGFDSSAVDVSADGSVVVGTARDIAGLHVFRWTAASGMQDVAPGFLGHAGGVSADGSVVVGTTALGGNQPFLWRETTGQIELLGTLPGATSAWGRAVSADGHVAVGEAYGGAPSTRAYRMGDADSDGIPDDWECNGIPYTDLQGQAQRYILDADGDGNFDADPLQRDIFVELDAMSGRAPSSAGLQDVVDAFNPAGKVLLPPPQGVPGGRPNVRLHIQTDTADLNLALLNNGNYTNGKFGFDDFAFDKSRYFGTPTERANPSWSSIKDAKRQVYRYCIFADTLRVRIGQHGQQRYLRGHRLR